MRKKSSHSSHLSVSPSSFFLLPFSLFNRTYADTLDLGCRKIAIASNSFPPSPSFPLLKKYSHHQRSNQIRIDRLQSPICRQSLFLLLLSIGCWTLGLCPLAFLRRLVPPRQQRIPLAMPPAQPLLSLIFIAAEP